MSDRPRDPLRRRILDWFLGLSATGLLGSILYPVARFVSPPRVPEAATNSVDAGPVDDPELLDKGFKIVRFGVEPVILIRAADDDFRALTATCTHLDCIVEYRPEKRLIWCNCHDGRYDLDGRNVGGPPPRPLTPLKVQIARKGSGSPHVIISRT